MGTAGMGDCLSGVLTSFITMLQSGIDYRAILYAIASIPTQQIFYRLVMRQLGY